VVELDKGKGAVPQWGLGEVLISQTLAVEPAGEMVNGPLSL